MKKILLGLLLCFVSASAYCGWSDGLSVDEWGNAMVVMTYNHSQVHRGEAFMVSSFTVSLANGASAYFVIDCATNTLKSSEVHGIIDVGTGGNLHVELFKNPVIVSSGTALSIMNMNQGSTNTAGLRVTDNATVVSSNGTRLYEGMIAGGSSPRGVNAGGGSRDDEETIFAQGTNYLFKVTNISGAAVPVSLKMEWYEER